MDQQKITLQLTVAEVNQIVALIDLAVKAHGLRVAADAVGVLSTIQSVMSGAMPSKE